MIHGPSEPDPSPDTESEERWTIYVCSCGAVSLTDHWTHGCKPSYRAIEVVPASRLSDSPRSEERTGPRGSESAPRTDTAFVGFRPVAAHTERQAMSPPDGSDQGSRIVASPELLEAASEVDRTCRELAWWTKPVAPPDELTEPARAAIRRLRSVLSDSTSREEPDA